ncbi:MAG: MarR family transcriptional regulator, partial [Pseudomonadota bacterium]
AKEGGVADRRLVSLTLTAKGRAMMAELIPLAEGYERDLLASLPAAERAALDRAIAKLMETET